MAKRESEDGATIHYARFSEDLGLYVEMVLKDDEVVSLRMSSEEPERPYGTEHPYLTKVMGHLSTGKEDLRDIPVHLNVSPFDLQVLQALREIPPGEVATYGEIAARLGRPRAARAVGSACARNPVPIIIPCHRVVPASGGLGNYSGGEGWSTKAAILRKEGVSASAGRASRS
jgi:O-6-methylguanine DNA methyltransferase